VVARLTALACGGALVAAVAAPGAGAAAAAVTRGPAPTSVTLGVSPLSPQRAGTSYSIKVALAPAAVPGSISLYDNGTLVASGVHRQRFFSFTTSASTVGSHELRAHFVPDDQASYAPSTAAVHDYVSPAGARAGFGPVAGPPSYPHTTACSLSSELVPSCGVILGAYPTSFGGSNVYSAFNDFNNKSGSTLSLAHDYRGPGDTLTSSDDQLARMRDTLLLVNYKPTENFVQAAGGNSQVNSQIDAMARSVKALAPVKIMMTIYHEGENNVSGGASGCPSSIYKGTSGTPAQYREMWSNVESRFAADGVTNVVWAIDFTGYVTWNCMVDDLWPGNSLVDWVMWDPYMTDSRDFSESVGSLYSWLTQTSNSAHDYLSKPWGIAEFGDLNDSDARQNTFYTTVAASLDANQFPKLKLLTLYDAIGNLGDSRVAYDEQGDRDNREVADLRTLSSDPIVIEGQESVDGG
jgi:hypothetical protein